MDFKINDSPDCRLYHSKIRKTPFSRNVPSQRIRFLTNRDKNAALSLVAAARDSEDDPSGFPVDAGLPWIPVRKMLQAQSSVVCQYRTNRDVTSKDRIWSFDLSTLAQARRCGLFGFSRNSEQCLILSSVRKDQDLQCKRCWKSNPAAYNCSWETKEVVGGSYPIVATEHIQNSTIFEREL